MTYKIVDINNSSDYKEVATSLKEENFLQTYAWGEFQKSTGNKIYRYALEQDGVVVAYGTFIEKSLPLSKKYLYCPSGPFSKGDVVGIFSKEILKEHADVLFIRVEPSELVKNSSHKVNKTIDIQPSKTIILNLTKKEDVLLNEMHQKTRYNIRLASKKGVKIRECKISEFDKFWKLMQVTGTRDGFRLHKQSYYKKMLEQLSDTSEIKVKAFLAEYKGVIVTVGLFAFSGRVVTYLHGASANEHRNVMAPYLLQWTIIKVAKNNGYKAYDFYGIDDQKWPGVTRFKRGYGGKEVMRQGTFDIIANNFLYTAYNLIRNIRRR